MPSNVENLKVSFLTLVSISIVMLFYIFQRDSSIFISPENFHYYEVNAYDLPYEHVPGSGNIKVIPIPSQISVQNSVLLISNGFRIISQQKVNNDLHSAIIRFSKYISSVAKITVEISQKSLSSNNQLTIDCPTMSVGAMYDPKLGEDESYALNVSTTGAYLYAPSYTSIIRGLATFVQLIERNLSAEIVYIPHVNIVDQPRFPWRGLMLDVCRHWMPVEVVERTLNAMELGKFNVLHLHLSDDQGFRLESYQYKLLHDRKDYFTQRDIQHIVEYARKRCIRIVPEFDMPAHSTSWFVGYPELASEPGPYQIEKRWGIMKPTMDPTKESTYTFLDNFFEEITKLFPDKYFHIGGDEVEGNQWKESKTIQDFIIANNLDGQTGLQAYFNKRVEKILEKYQKTMIGWEEIFGQFNNKSFELGGDAIIQVWKNRELASAALHKGYQILISRGYYLDHLASSLVHYLNDPVVHKDFYYLNEEQKSRVLGGEACMWSEFVSKDTIDSRLWPRALAVAERLWSPIIHNNRRYLYERLFRMSRLLDESKTGVTHLSSYKTRLQNLILDPKKKTELLHPLMILADVCEPYGFNERSSLQKYSAFVPLTTFTDVLQPESEIIWRLETITFEDKIFRDIFQSWITNSVRLSPLFTYVDRKRHGELWGQDIQELSNSLADVGRIGLRLLDYLRNGTLHRDKKHIMNSWKLIDWVFYHRKLLERLEDIVPEVRLAAVRPVRRVLHLITHNH